MFTLEQINEIHDRFGNADTLSPFLRALKDLGVTRCDSFVTDGHSEYVGEQGQNLASPPAHEAFAIAETSNRETFLEQLELAGQGRTSYLEMSQGLAASGVEKWTFDTLRMTMTYYDKNGYPLLVEDIA